MSKIHNRYAGAVHSGNLRSRPATEMSDSDVLGAAGLAAKNVPIGVALLRLAAGDDREALTLVRILASMAWGKAKAEGVRLKRVQADDMARTVVAWLNKGTCTTCSGHGYMAIGGREMFGQSRTVIGDELCPDCRGSRKVNFDLLFVLEHLLIARWLKDQIEREQAIAGAEIMKALAPRMDL